MTTVRFRNTPWEPHRIPIGFRPSSTSENTSPANGIIQYKSNAFGGRLRRRLLVCRYNVPGDIAVLEIEPATGAIKAYAPRIAGFSRPEQIRSILPRTRR
jgi:hypothetical protein